MKNRPIKPLVDALQSLGADITYLEKKVFRRCKSSERRLKTIWLKFQPMFPASF
jgi:3-phosphoshikimate 1-carboxyvinyltransferase